MLSETLKLKTEQLLKNRLWRHSITVDPSRSVPGEIAELLTALIDGLREETEGPLRAYVVLPEGSFDRRFFDAIQMAECARFPLTGSFGSKGDDGEWRSAPMVFHLADVGLLDEFIPEHWGEDSFAIFFSPLGPLEFFRAVAAFGLVRREGGNLVWAPYWNPPSFEKYLSESDSRRTDRIFRHVAYYLAEGGAGRVVRIYCRGGFEEET
ncbi:MAG: hypothetical protein ABIK65_06060 [Candidatus Eisenbacteria bacterium]